MTRTLQVSVPVPREEVFSYSVSQEHVKSVQIGKRVIAPFGNRKVIGFIVGYEAPPQNIELKNIIDVLDDKPLFDRKRLDFFKWISKYYLCPLGIVLKAAHPGVFNQGIKRTVILTDKGKRYLNRSSLSGVETQILNTLNIRGRMTAERVFSITGGSDFNTLNKLKRKDLIDFEYDFRDRAKKKFRKFYEPAGHSPDSKKLSSKPAKRSLFEFISRHGKVSHDDLRSIFPAFSKHARWLEEQGFIRTELIEHIRDPFSNIAPAVKHDIPTLNPGQENAFSQIKHSIESGRFSPYLLHGITGSGKTEIYLRSIELVMTKGKQAIVMVPEISLTPQLVKRFKSRFGEKVGVIHSMLSDGERFDTWRQAKNGEISVVIGARSAIFAPFDNLGIVIVDEEHENTYKQEEMPPYNARDLSMVLGRMTGSVVVLGSATPSLESYRNAITGKFGYLVLNERAAGQALPEIVAVDMKKESDHMFSGTLKSSIIENYRAGKQTILFLNRRGYSTTLLCEKCGSIHKCPNCSIAFTYHKNDNRIKCHYCGIDEAFSNECTECGSVYRGIGIGTQTVEYALRKLLPSASIHRMDSDTAGSKYKLLRLYEMLEEGSVDILIGTQMVAKGHDLPGVTLVGIISADMMLGIPDFRAGERAFQLITQVAGRAGRGDSAGTVIVQTFNDDHPCIRYAVEQDSDAFFGYETELRESLGYPPYSRIANIRMSGQDENQTEQFAKDLSRKARAGLYGSRNPGIEILGPSKCPLYRLKNRFRWQMLLKAGDSGLLHSFAEALLKKASPAARSRVRFSIDIDPNNFY